MYLADRVVDDNVTEIHEQEVGHKVFGRPANYDTTGDNIVRVHASMLRKRLEQYFETDGADEPVIIEVPKGNYALVFRPRRVGPVVALPPIPSTRRSVLPWVLAAVAAVLACSTAYLGWRLAARPQATVVAGPVVRAFWSQLFHAGAVTDIVVDDAAVGIYQDVTGRPLKLADYFDRDYLRNLGPREDGLPDIVIRRQTSYANLSFLFKLLQMPGDRSHAVLHFARDYSFRELKANHAILLGNRRTNPWIETFEPKLGIRWTYDLSAGVYHASDSWAGGKTFPAGRDGRESYCGIALLPNLGASGNVLIVSGSGGSAFTAAADFLADEQGLAALRRMLPASGAGFPPFEALIQVNGRSAAARDKTIVLARTPR